jgi:hypothetical protein
VVFGAQLLHFGNNVQQCRVGACALQEEQAMAHAANDVPGSRPPALPREVLAELVRDASAAANEQLSAMANRLAAAMGDMSTAGLDPQAAYRRAKAGNLLKNKALFALNVESS